MKYTSRTQLHSPRLLATVLFATVAAIASTNAFAAGPTTAQAQEQYRIDVERCRSGQTSQDTKTCIREAGAALQEARRHRLIEGTPSFDQNQRARCERLTGTQREDCLRLMADPNPEIRGSVDGGGIIRETTITIPATGTTPGYGEGLTPASPGTGMMPVR